MHRQKSFINEKATLYLVATPIGNMEEMTPRAINTLKNVKYIACEDTRTSKPLLDHFDIKAKLLAYHNFNEEHSAKGLLEILNSGEDVALISDAGYPLVSDPGFTIRDKCLENDINVVTISGPSAGLHALVASGLDTRHYLFYGFLNEKKSKAKKELEELVSFPYTLIFYESPHRIFDTLNSMLEILGDRKIVLARELSKKYEEYIRGNISEVLTCEDIKGEMVILVEGKAKDDLPEIADIKAMVDKLVEDGLSSKDAIKQVAKELKMSKNDIYREYHKEEG